MNLGILNSSEVENVTSFSIDEDAEKTLELTFTEEPSDKSLFNKPINIDSGFDLIKSVFMMKIVDAKHDNKELIRNIDNAKNLLSNEKFKNSVIKKNYFNNAEMKQFMYNFINPFLKNEVINLVGVTSRPPIIITADLTDEAIEEYSKLIYFTKNNGIEINCPMIVPIHKVKVKSKRSGEEVQVSSQLPFVDEVVSKLLSKVTKKDIKVYLNIINNQNAIKTSHSGDECTFAYIYVKELQIRASNSKKRKTNLSDSGLLVKRHCISLEAPSTSAAGETENETSTKGEKKKLNNFVFTAIAYLRCTWEKI